MRLYYTPGSCSLASHIIACEAGLEIDYDRVDLRNKTTASGRDFAKISPMGSVPALALPSGEVLTEASVIAQFLADQAPTTRLMPEAGSLERYRVQEWLGFVGTELHPGFSALWNPMTPEAGRRMAIDLLHRRFAHLDNHLDGRSYLMGDHFTVADAYAYTVLSWSGFHKISLAAYPSLRAFMARVEERPKVREALEAEGLLK